jgi:thiol-disulfide isomerase/thioredoxin
VAVAWAAPSVQTADVKTLQGVLKSHRGSVVLVYFWASWSKPSLRSLPDLAALQSQYGSQGLQIVGVSSDDAHTANAEVLQEKVNFPTYVETGNHQALARFFSATWVGQPGAAFIYNRKGALVHELHGRQSLKDYQTVLAALL